VGKATVPDNILDTIVASKHREIAIAKEKSPESELRRRVADAPPVRPFREALCRPGRVSVIAEVKKASPSAGVLRADFDPVAIAGTYAKNGAACLSVLTDEPFFQGRLEYLTAIRRAVELPILRKEFVLDAYQVLEARVAGADAVLLIAEILPGEQVAKLLAEVGALGMDALVELHDAAELSRVLASGADLVGINNRDLRTFATRLEHSLDIAPHVPKDVCLVSESGIRTREDVERLRIAGIGAVLVGESLLRAPDIGAALRALLQP
jgi:indole-3-glycerol phosphate synthase